MSAQLPMIDARTVAIFKAIEGQTGIGFEAMLEPGRTRRESYGRSLAAFLLRQEGWEWGAIAELLRRTHLSVVWIAGRVLKEPKYAADLKAIREALPALPPRSEAAP